MFERSETGCSRCYSAGADRRPRFGSSRPSGRIVPRRRL